MFHPINSKRISRLCPVVVAVLLAVFSSAGLTQVEAQNVPAVGNIGIRDGTNPGEVVVSWDAVSQATHYRIGYVNMVTDYPLAKASVTGDWINAFIYVDEDARNLRVSNGRAEYTVRRLAQGTRHAFTVLTSNNFVDTGNAGSVSSEFVWPTNPRWQFHDVADQGGACPVVVSPPASDCVSDGTCIRIQQIGTFAGSGDSVQHAFALRAGVYRFTASRTMTDGNFFIDVIELASGDSRSVGIYGRDQTGGQEALTIYGPDRSFGLKAGNYMLDVDTDHDWSVRVELIQAQSTDSQTSVACTGDDCDRDALAAFYDASNGDDWTNNDNWLSSSALTEWRGVNMRQDGRVEGLFIRSNGLSGHLAPELGNLSEMDYLDLGFNQLTGSIPSQLGNLTKLESLYIFDNQLSGPIPASLGNITAMRTLHLANNQLTGSIPAELGNLSNLKQLLLQGNSFSGPIPASLGNLDNLEWIHLSANNLTGCIPAGLRDVPNNDFDHLGLPFC